MERLITINNYLKMIDKYISKLEFTSFKNDKIKAVEVPINGLKSYIYYDYSNLLHLIIKSDVSIKENRKGIKVCNSTLDIIDVGKHNYIDIVCTHKDFKVEFVEIVEQIITHFKKNKDLLKAIKYTINRWYYFFEKDLNNELSISEIIGLIGELLFIKNNLNNYSYKEIINSWKGPESGLRDFNFDNYDIEVKTSAKEIGHVHTINGQIQLRSDNSPIYVYSVSLKKSNSTNGLTIKKLIDFICLEISFDSLLLNDFFEKLEKLKVIVPTADQYDDYSYELNNILILKIDHLNVEQFQVKNKNSRISNLKYDYDFNGLKSVEIG